MSELPSGWASVRLGSLGVWVGGGTPSKREQTYWGGEIPWVSPKDMKVSRIRNTIDHITREGVENSATTVVPTGSVLAVTRSGILRHTFPVAIADREMALNQDLKALLPGTGIVSGFVAWALRSFERSILAECGKAGTTVQNIDTEKLLRFEISIAPTSEQQRIVAAIEEQFSRLDSSETTLRRAMRNLGRLREAAVAPVLSGNWPVAKLSDLSKLITKGTTPTSIGFAFADDGVLFVKAESIIKGWIDHSRCAHVDEYADQALARSRLAEDDLLVTIAGTLGRVGRVRAIDLPANTNQAVSLIRLKDRELVPWVSTWLQGPVAQRYLRTAGRGVGLQNLNLKQVAETPLPIPAVADRHRVISDIDRKLSLIDALTAEIDAALQRSQALRRSILEQAFTGKLVPQDPDDEPVSVLLERIAAERAAAAPVKRRGRGRPRRAATPGSPR